ncbi:Ras GTPase-activating-like protein IQGAP2/3 [Nematocida displodere]|uniref:Ras GTPase-activating-like protein IQGAP2/3 n=1 Tax=Nematocida displodere TaxID=1805483 RepID=A0A177ECB7_9MICR|nr:Ras GTPase-activating-like protein IQGAP2/3 [Nematocida displodere]
MQGAGAYYSTIEDDRMLSAEEMDRERKKNRIYEYLCHLEEAKVWLQKEIGEEISAEVFEESLRDGVFLAKLVRNFYPKLVEKIFEDKTLQYRHTDNINAFFRFTKEVGLPFVFLFELVDLYEQKNIPKVIYCIHALAHFLSKKKVSGKLKSLVGTAQFTEEQIAKKEKEIEASGITLPRFSNISSAIDRPDAFATIYAPGTSQSSRNSQDEDTFPVSASVSSLLPALDTIAGTKTQTETGTQTGTQSETGTVTQTQTLEGGIAYEEMSESDLKREMYRKPVATIQACVRTLLALKMFSELKGESPISIFSLRCLLPLLSGMEEQDECIIDELNKILSSLFTENAVKEKRLSSLENRISLLIKNKIGAGSKKKEKEAAGTYMQFKSLQKLFACMHDDPTILSQMILSMKQREAEVFVNRRLLPLFGSGKTLREEYSCLRVIEELLLSETKTTSRPIDYLAGKAIRRLLVAHGTLDVQNKIRAYILSGHVAGAPLEVGILEILQHNAHLLPYPLRFYGQALYMGLAEKHRDRSEENLKTLFSVLWEVFFAPLIVAPETFTGKELPGDKQVLLDACTAVGKLFSGSSSQDHQNLWRSMILDLVEVCSISEYYRAQYIENRSMSNLLCLSGEEVNHLLIALAACASVPEEVQDLVTSCTPLPFKLVFVVPGGLASASIDEGSVEKRVAKWCLVRLLLCSSGRNVSELLQRRATKEEEESFKKISGVDIEKYKDDLKVLLIRLYDLGIVKNPDTCEEILAITARDIFYRVRLSFSRKREILATEKAISRLESARKDIEMRQKTCTEYLTMLSTKIMSVTKTCTKSATALLEKGVLCRMYNWLPSQLESIELSFAGDSTGGIVISVFVLGMLSASETVTLDELLLKESHAEAEMHLENIGCALSITKTIALINKKFLR